MSQYHGLKYDGGGEKLQYQERKYDRGGEVAQNHELKYDRSGEMLHLRGSFAVCFRTFNFLAIQRVNVLQTVNPRAFKTSQGIRGGAPLSGSAAVGAAQ